VTDYWRMVWEQKVELVVMITKLVELGRVKAHEYWPVNVGDVNTLDNGMQITLVKTEAKLLADCKLDPEQIAVRTFEVVNTKAKSKTPQVVVHVHYMAWPDHGVPSLDNFLDLFKVYRHLRVNLPWDVGNPHTPARDEGQDASSSSSSFMLSCDCPRAPPIVVHCSAGIGRTGTFIAIDSILDLLRDGHRKVRRARACVCVYVRTY
jgi:tyrosine-protein phosphatase non-receptor type 9